MRWHAEKRGKEGDNDLIHPRDGEAWENFNKEFPEFAHEIRNVRLGLSTDGFNPFGVSGLSHCTWPIIVMLPWMCMNKEFNILAMLISGPKSPGKCLNVFMRPLIDELKMLWNTGVATFDHFSGSSFNMKAAIISTISDFPGLGMLGGLKTKGYKACPLCLDGIDATYLTGRMAYQGHRRWLSKDHAWRKASDKFNGHVELRDRAPFLSGREILDDILNHDFPTVSLHPKFRARGNTEKLCWTHKSIFYELPYWSTFIQLYSLDVMDIKKNVFDNIIGTILALEGKTKDDHKARAGLKEQGVHKHLWDKFKGSSSKRQKVTQTQAPYTVLPEHKVEILEMVKDVKYPYGYAGSLRSKINLHDKKFNGLKTHDCHVMLHLERIFPPAFFTIMVHLLVHLPDQILLKGPVHYSWMYPTERQLSEYKRHVRNTRYPEGCMLNNTLSKSV
ncbi:unnamed protein product [Rhodiola kirilowii]